MHTIHHGDCLDVLRTMGDGTVDAVVTDPPAGIAFMGKAWDGDRGGRDQWVAWLAERLAECLRVLKPGGHAVVWALPRTSGWTHRALEDAGFEVRDCITHLFGSGFPKSLDVGKAIDKAAGAERIELLGPKAGHADFVGRVDAHSGGGRNGWDRPCRDDPEAVARSHMSFAPATPEAQQWDGFGTALKPAAEFWYLARKPFAGTVAGNVVEHGTGALNIDGCRVAATDKAAPPVGARRGSAVYAQDGYTQTYIRTEDTKPQSRWPANVVLTHNADCDGDCSPGCAVAELDEQSGMTQRADPRGFQRPERRGKGAVGGWAGYTGGRGVSELSPDRCDSGGASRFFATFRYGLSERAPWCMLSGWKCSNASIADDLARITPALSVDTAQVLVTTKPDDWIVRLVASAGTLCVTCATVIAHTIVLMQQDHSRIPPLGLPFTDAFSERTLTQNLALCAEALDSSDTTSITTNLAISLGCVVSVISESITRASVPSTNGSDQFVPYKYQAKPSTAEKSAGLDGRNPHPTVKPVELMRWLVRLVTPPGGTVLDCFAGSGTTLVAAILEGFDCIGIEDDGASLPIIEGRVAWAERQAIPQTLFGA